MSQNRKYAVAARFCVAAALFVAAAGGTARGQTTAGRMVIAGQIESITVDDMSDPGSGGSVVIDGKSVVIPKQLLINVRGKRLTLRDLVLDGPEQCTSQKPPQSGLAVSDTCRNGTSAAQAKVLADRSASGDLVANIVLVQKGTGQTGDAARPQRAYPGGGRYTGYSKPQ